MRNKYTWMKRSAALVLMFSLVMALGCSSKPSRSVATTEINHFLEFFDLPLLLDVGKIQKCRRDPTSDTHYPDDPASDISYPVAEKLGYITVRTEGDKFWQIDLTDAGRSDLERRKHYPYAHEANSCGDYSQVDFLVAERKVTTISGITPYPEEGGVAVTFKWKWVPTEMGRRLLPSGDVYLQLSSDQRRALLHDLQFNGPGFEMESSTGSAERDAKVLLKKTDKGWKAVK